MCAIFWGACERILPKRKWLELTNGIYRAKTEGHRQRREAFVEGLLHSLAVYPITLEIARLAGRIEGQQVSQGISIALPDLLIGVTALHRGDSVATINVRHFQLIPGLSVVEIQNTAR